MGRTGKIIFIISLVLILAGCQSNQKMGYCFDVAFDQESNRLYVAAGQAGLHVLDVVGKGRLEYVSTHFDGGYYRNLKLHAGQAYIAEADNTGLLILDISGETPVTKWSQNGYGAGLHIDGDTLYFVDFDSGLYIFYISNPDAPQQLVQFELLEQPWDIWVHQGIAFIVDVNKGLIILDVTTPTEPHQVGFITWDVEEPMAEVIRGEGKFLFIASGKHGLVIIDASNPTNPVLAATYDPGPDSFGEGLFVRDHVVYLAVGDKKNRQENGLHILDVSDPYSPNVISKLPFEDWVEGIFVASDYAFIANTYSGVRSIDISDLEHPLLVDHFSSVE
jgi:hypothetical protein